MVDAGAHLAVPAWDQGVDRVGYWAMGLFDEEQVTLIEFPDKVLLRKIGLAPAEDIRLMSRSGAALSGIRWS